MRKDDEVAPASATNQNQGCLATEVALLVGELAGGGSATRCRDCQMTAMSRVRDVAICDRLENGPRKDIAPVWTRSFPIAKEPTTCGEHLKKKRFGTGIGYRSLIDLERPCDQVISAAGYFAHIICVGHGEQVRPNALDGCRLGWPWGWKPHPWCRCPVPRLG